MTTTNSSDKVESDEPNFFQCYSHSGNDNSFGIKCCAYAYDVLYQVQIIAGIAPHTSAKAFNAVLQMKWGEEKSSSASRITIRGAGEKRWSGERQDLSLLNYHSGYTIHKQRVLGDYYYFVAIANNPSLILMDDDPNGNYDMEMNLVWKYLRSESITTPILIEWLPYIFKTMCENTVKVNGRGGGTWSQRVHMIQKLKSHNCAASIIYAKTELIDKIVSEGIKSGDITIDA